MRIVAAAVVLVLVVAAGADGIRARGAREITAATAVATGDWVAAVRSHTPGQRDAAAVKAAAMTFDDRIDLDAGMELFLSALQGRAVVAKSPAQKRIAELGSTARQSPGPNAFLKRAAVLHGDAALLNGTDGVRAPAPPQSPSPGSTSPLLTRKRLLLDSDGEIQGAVAAEWNWPFARSLLDLILPHPGDDPFVAAWYHATSAVMFKQGLYGEAVTHLERAAVVLPEDPLVLFDRAVYLEIQGLPRSQVLLSDEDLVALRGRQAGRPVRGTSQTSFQLGIPPSEVANDQAERLFRRALRADPALVEARVRLGRLLGEQKHHDEALVELRAALGREPAGPVSFYAHLFAGRAAQALGKNDEALAHFRAASALFPGSQSALLAESQASLLAADVRAALEAIDRLDRSSSARDPWWKYHLGAGRDADALLRAMWAKVAGS
ncbi:MAG TPA: tetratricopeptide repeat protein [Vicinamibacterales bacterium]|nr:tetratricopeptide repeat protein [Vicinamibacterales bacterium]